MREIKFRGKCINEDAWAYGSLVQRSGRAFIFEEGVHAPQCKIGELLTEVIPESVGEFTGLKDKNGREIYEGDLLRVWQEDEYIPNRDSGGGIIDYDCKVGFSQIGKVGFTGCSFDYRTIKTLIGEREEIHLPIDWIENFEVIGNIYENPELLEGEAH